MNVLLETAAMALRLSADVFQLVSLPARVCEHFVSMRKLHCSAQWTTHVCLLAAMDT